jgi:hypothetical protein
MVEKVVPIWMGVVEAAVELMWENRIEGDDLEASWELLEPYGPEAVEKGKELYRERLEAERVEAERTVEAEDTIEEEGPEVKFHESDHAPRRRLGQPITIEEKNRKLEELADLWDTDPIGYAELRKEVAAQLCINQQSVDRAVKLVRDRRPKDEEQSQATKLMAVGLSEAVGLWRSPNRMGHASVLVDGHMEHYRIESSAFEHWLRREYGRVNQVKIGDRLFPQVPGTQAVRDAVASLNGYALGRGDVRKAWMRVGGDRDVIWIDLGRPDWNAVKVTRDGWSVVRQAGIPFVRGATMLPLPIPEPGGDVRKLRGVLNVRDGDFVLVPAWLAQALNPIGDYPFLNAYGESEMGKTLTCTTMLRTVDPSTTGLRKMRKPDDLLIAARNNWAIGIDNQSWMSLDLSDTLCMVSTGITSGTRKLYSDDEEHTFTVRNPVVFNGIPHDLVEKSDLISRTIKLEIPRLIERRAKDDLEREFVEIWPGVFGALLDGIVGGLRDQASVMVGDAARLYDFERFGEAACRAMGFADWEFVNAYKANRLGAMAASAEGSPVGRAVIAFLKKRPDGFKGQMSTLYDKLETYRGNTNARDWPKSPNKLSSKLSRLAKPLAALGINCVTGVDRRYEVPPGTQHDVIIERAAPVVEKIVAIKDVAKFKRRM